MSTDVHCDFLVVRLVAIGAEVERTFSHRFACSRAARSSSRHVASSRQKNNGLEQFGDKPSRVGRESIDFLRRYTPGGSIWYAQTAYNRLVLDNLQRILDPEAEKQWRRQEKRREKEWGNASYWYPGEPLPG